MKRLIWKWTGRRLTFLQFLEDLQRYLVLQTVCLVLSWQLGQHPWNRAAWLWVLALFMLETIVCSVFFWNFSKHKRKWLGGRGVLWTLIVLDKALITAAYDVMQVEAVFAVGCVVPVVLIRGFYRLPSQIIQNGVCLNRAKDVQVLHNFSKARDFPQGLGLGVDASFSLERSLQFFSRSSTNLLNKFLKR